MVVTDITLKHCLNTTTVYSNKWYHSPTILENLRMQQTIKKVWAGIEFLDAESKEPIHIHKSVQKVYGGPITNMNSIQFWAKCINQVGWWEERGGGDLQYIPCSGHPPTAMILEYMCQVGGRIYSYHPTTTEELCSMLLIGKPSSHNWAMSRPSLLVCH